LEARGEAEIESVFSKLAQVRADTLLVLGSPLFSGRAAQLAKLAAGNAIPTIVPGRFFVENGALLGYGLDVPAA
jgi:hypothetical protein